MILSPPKNLGYIDWATEKILIGRRSRRFSCFWLVQLFAWIDSTSTCFYLDFVIGFLLLQGACAGGSLYNTCNWALFRRCSVLLFPWTFRARVLALLLIMISMYKLIEPVRWIGIWFCFQLLSGTNPLPVKATWRIGWSHTSWRLGRRIWIF
jgi:hypothetical protein